MFSNDEIKSGKSPLLMVSLFLLANALKTAFIYLVFEQFTGFAQLFVHFLPSLFFCSAVFGTLMLRGWRLSFLVAYLVQTAYLAANLGYYLFYHDLLHLNCLYGLRGESIQVLQSLSFTYPPIMYLVLIDLPAFAYLLWHFRQLVIPLAARPWFRRVPAGAALLFFGSLGILYLTALPLPKTSGSGDLTKEMAVVNRFGFLAHHLYDLLEGPGSTVGRAKIVYGRKFTTPAGPTHQSNIIMIQFESLDANIVNYRHHDHYVAPFLHELAAGNIYYPYTLCYRKAGGTSDCEIAVLNSVEPLAKSVTMHSDTYQFPNAVPKKLPRAYDSKAFHGNTGNFFKRDTAYPRMGFREFYDRVRMNLPEQGWGASDRNLFQFVESQLARERSPFFYYLITMSSHEPFTNIRSYYRDLRFDDIDHELTRNYFASIAYVDAQLREFVTQVTSRFPDTYLFIYGDHTPYVINDGPYQRAAVRVDQQEIEFVPLIIVTPAHTRYTERRLVASYLDLAPTVLCASGARASMLTGGVNLLDTPLRQTSIPYRGNDYSREQLFKLASRHEEVDGTAPGAGLLGLLHELPTGFRSPHSNP